MDRQSALDFLRALKIDTRNPVNQRGSSGEWVNFPCPFAQWTHAGGTDNSPSFGVRVNEEGRSYYKCWSCGAKGSLSILGSKLGHYRKKDYTHLVHQAELTEMNSRKTLMLPSWEDTDEFDNDNVAIDYKPVAPLRLASPLGHPYLTGRGITWRTALSLGLQYDPYQRRILFPVYSPLGDLQGYTGRSILPESAYDKFYPKVRDYKGLDKRKLLLTPPPRNNFMNSTSLSPQPLVLCEGLFDYARIWQAGHWNVAAILGTAITPEKEQIIIKHHGAVTFFFDNDQAGRNAIYGLPNDDGTYDTGQSWGARISPYMPVFLARYPKDADDVDPGQLSDDQIKKAIKNSRAYVGK